VLFDIDGTIADSLPLIAEAMHETLLAHGHRIERAVIEAAIGPPLAVMVRELTGESVERSELIFRDYLARYLDGYAPRTPPMPGAPELIARLRARGARLAVVTNKLEHSAQPVLDAIGCGDAFELIVGADTLAQQKPHPEPALHALRQLGVAPGRRRAGDRPQLHPRRGGAARGGRDRRLRLARQGGGAARAGQDRGTAGRRMNSARCEVTASERLYGDTHVLWLRMPDELNHAYPGQFVMAYIGEYDDPLLGRALSVHRVREGRDGPEFALLFDVVGRGTDWLSRRIAGDAVRVVGPLGRGFEPRSRVQRMLLVGGGIGCAPLVWLAERLVVEGREVTLILGGRSEAQIFPARMLPPAVEVVVTTEDGSAGERGTVTKPFERLLPWCDQAFACGPDAMFEALHGVARRSGLRKPLQGLLEAPMACGMGICYSCAVFPRRGGVKLVCRDGPMFDLRDLY
jgi:dihydroorotate dehydrogenase electron transfer subunit